MKIFNKEAIYIIQNIKNFTLNISFLFRLFFLARKGIVAIEFAFLLPIFILLYFGTVEICSIIEYKRNLHRMVVSFADVLSKKKNVTPRELSYIREFSFMNIQKRNHGKQRRTPKIIVSTKINKKANSSFKDWFFISPEFYYSNTEVEPINEIKPPNPDFLIRIKITSSYMFLTSSVFKDFAIPLESTVYITSHGTGAAIECKDCRKIQ